MKKIVALIVLVFSLFLIVGCGPAENVPEGVEPAPKQALAGQAVYNNLNAEMLAEGIRLDAGWNTITWSGDLGEVSVQEAIDSQGENIPYVYSYSDRGYNYNDNTAFARNRDAFSNFVPNQRYAVNAREETIWQYGEAAGEVAPEEDARPTPPFVAAVSENGPASDLLLVTHVLTDLQQDGYEIGQDVTVQFSELEGSDLDNQVTLLVYEGEARLVVGENSPARHNLFATEVGVKLDDRGVDTTNIMRLNTEVDSSNLEAAFLRPTPPFVAAVSENAPATDNLFMTDILVVLRDKGYDVRDVSRLYSEVEGNSLDNQVTLVVMGQGARVVVGENSPASHNLFAVEVGEAIQQVQDLLKLSSEVDENDLETAFRR